MQRKNIHTPFGRSRVPRHIRQLLDKKQKESIMGICYHTPTRAVLRRKAIFFVTTSNRILAHDGTQVELDPSTSCLISKAEEFKKGAFLFPSVVVLGYPRSLMFTYDDDGLVTATLQSIHHDNVTDAVGGGSDSSKELFRIMDETTLLFKAEE